MALEEREPVPGPGPGPTPLSRESAVWAGYEERRKADQLDLSLAGGGVGVGIESASASGRGGLEEGVEEGKRERGYGLPTEEEIRAVLLRAAARTGGTADTNVGKEKGKEKGMTRAQLEVALTGTRWIVKLGLRERLDEVIERLGLAVEGEDRVVWRDDVRGE